MDEEDRRVFKLMLIALEDIRASIKDIQNEVAIIEMRGNKN